jgi:hypothetical protein
MCGQNPGHVVTGHPRLLINDAIADTWEPAKTRLTAIEQRVMGGNATATSDFAALVSVVNANLPLGNNSPQGNITAALDYGFVYQMYLKAGQTSKANAVAAAAWAAYTSSGLGGEVDPISRIVVTAGGGNYGPNTATATFANPPVTVVPGIGYDYMIWGVSGADWLCGFQHIMSASSSGFTFATSGSPGTYTNSGMVGTAYFGGTDQHGYSGAQLSQLAYLYDWLYPWLVANGHDAYVRAQITTSYWANTLTRQSSMFSDNVRESDYHNYTSWNEAAILEAGVALYGDDPLGAAILAEGMGYYWLGQPGIQPAGCCSDTVTYNIKTSVDALTGGAFNWESPAYWRNGAINHLRAIEACDSGTARYYNLWTTQFPTAKNAGMYKIYVQRPDGYAANLGDGGNAIEYSGRDQFGIAVINDRFPDPHFVWMMTAYSAATKPYGYGAGYWNSGSNNGNDGIVHKLIFFPYVNGPGSHNLADLPLAQQFGPDIIMRTGWGPSDTYVTYTTSIRGTYHRHEDAGSFTVFKNSPLIAAQPYSLVEPAYTNYHRRTNGANSITVYDPDDCWKATGPKCGLNGDNGNAYIVNDGGQLMSDRRLYNQFTTNEFQISRLWSGSLYSDPAWSTLYSAIDPASAALFAAGTGYEHIQHNMTSVYVNSYTGAGDNPTAKVAPTNGVVREVVHFQPTQGTLDPIVTFDRVTSTNASFKKAWSIHTANAPTVNGTTSSPGDTTYSSATVTSADSGTGRVYVSHLLPAMPNVRAVGGNACTPIRILGATNANPAVFYAPNHGLQAGEMVGIDTGTVRGGSTWAPNASTPNGWFLDNAYITAQVASVPDSSHFTIMGGNGSDGAYDSSTWQTWAAAFLTSSGHPSGSGSFVGQIDYDTSSPSGGNTVWQWDGSNWRNLYVAFGSIGYPAGLGYTAPIVYSHSNCNYAFYVDQLGPKGSGGAHLWNSSTDGALYSNMALQPQWAIMEEPAGNELTDYFLNVVTATTTSVNSPPSVSLVEGDRSFGVQIADSAGTYVAMFSTSNTVIDQRRYRVPHAGAAMHVVSGLKQGEYTVKQNGQAISGAYRADKSGAIAFHETGGGSFEVSPAVKPQTAIGAGVGRAGEEIR